MTNILHGVRRFYENVYTRKKDFFGKLANGQKPTVLFICCSDSRICPNLLMQTQPGDAFVLRNAGNIIPPEESDWGAEGASIEFALNSFPIREIVVCGHSSCGAVSAVMAETTTTPKIEHWLRFAVNKDELDPEKIADFTHAELLKYACQANILKQIRHLQTHQMVKDALQSGAVRLHGWYYDIRFGMVFAYNFAKDRFEPICGQAFEPRGEDSAERLEILADK